MDRITLFKRVLIAGSVILFILIILLTLYLSRQRKKEVSTKEKTETTQTEIDQYRSLTKEEIKEIERTMEQQINSQTDIEQKKEIAMAQIYSLRTATLPPETKKSFTKIVSAEKEKLEDLDKNNLILESSYFSNKKNIYINPITEEIVVSDKKSLEKVLSKKDIKTLEDFGLVNVKEDPSTLISDRITIIVGEKDQHIRTPLESEVDPVKNVQNFLNTFENRTFFNLLLNRNLELDLSITPSVALPQNNQATPTAIPQTSPNNNQPLYSPTPAPLEIPSSDIDSLLRYVAKNVGVPFGVLKGVLIIEGPQYLNLSSKEIKDYIKPNMVIPNCKPNVCSATGPMQITIGIDNRGSRSCSRCCWGNSCLDSKGGCPNQWAIYGDAVLKYEKSSRLPLPCNLLDNLYAAAEKIKTDSKASKSNNWTKEQVYRAALRYYGNCTKTYARLNNLTYCGFVYNVYKKLGD